MLASPAHASSYAEGDDEFIPDELVSRLYGGGENAVDAITATLSMRQRANLAVFCYHKSHLHGIGLAIAATCDHAIFAQMLGTSVGGTLYAQSRERPRSAERKSFRPKVTLASFTPSGPGWTDLTPDPSDTDDPSAGT
jgi:hypothetical protein